MIKAFQFLFILIAFTTFVAPSARADILSKVGGDYQIIHFEKLDAHGSHFKIQICSRDYKTCAADPAFGETVWERANITNQIHTVIDKQRVYELVFIGTIAIPGAIAAGVVAMGCVPEETLALIGVTLARVAAPVVGALAKTPAVRQALTASGSFAVKMGGGAFRSAKVSTTNLFKGDLKTIASFVVGGASVVSTAAATVNPTNWNDSNPIVLANNANYFFNDKAIDGCVISKTNAQVDLGYLDNVLTAIKSINKKSSGI